MVSVKIHSADEQEYRADLAHNDTFAQFLTTVSELSTIPTNQIRLIYRGKEIHTEQDFSACKVAEQPHLLLSRKSLHPPAIVEEPKSIVLRKYEVAWLLADNCERKSIITIF